MAEELNFTRAAGQAGVSQQVLSSQIRQRALAERGREVLATVEGLWEEARLRAGGAEGVLRFGFARSGLYDTTPRFRSFFASGPFNAGGLIQNSVELAAHLPRIGG